MLARKYPKSWDSSQNARGGQASRMRHALPEAVIHLHTDYAVVVNALDVLRQAVAAEKLRGQSAMPNLKGPSNQV